MLPAGHWNALSMRAKDVRVVERAALLIADLGADLDRQLGRERRPAEQLRMLRETTNRITRIANDAVNAYQRASRAVTAELAKPNGNKVAARQMRLVLDTARLEVLRALEMERHRYPSTDVAAPLPADRAEDARA